MTPQFTIADLERIASAIRTLTTPFNHATVDDWRLATNRELKELFGCSSVGFLLPGTSMPMYSEEHDQKALAGFPDLVPPTLADGTPIWTKMIDLEVCTLEKAYGVDHVDRYYRSAYYTDYASPNRARETMAACLPVKGFGPGGAASLHFWNDRTPKPAHFAERDLAVLRVLFPAFQAGVRAQLQLDPLRADLQAVIDSVNAAVMVADDAGRIVHETPALIRMLSDDPEGAGLRSTLAAMAAPAGSPALPRPTWEVATSSARYRLSMTRHERAATNGRALTLLLIERTSPRQRTAAELQAKFRLTPAESRVAVLLERGLSSAAIAGELSIAVATVRRHTERVFLKVGVHSRGELAARLRMES